MKRLVLGVALVVGLVYAGGHKGGFDRGNNVGFDRAAPADRVGHHNGGIFADLNLTYVQQAQIRDIHIASMAAIADEHNKTDTALKNATKNGYFDKTLFVSELTAGSTTRINNMADTMEKIYNVLTDSQKALLKQ